MFLGLIVVCGLETYPGSVHGCMPVSSNRFFKTEEECQMTNLMAIESSSIPIPPGARFEDSICVPVREGV